MNFSELITVLGIAGGAILVVGSMCREYPSRPPRKVAKHWLLAVGALLMLLYSTLQWINGGSVFFVYLQLFVNVTSIFMLTSTLDRYELGVTLITGLFFVIMSFLSFQDTTALFVLGLVGVGAGYVLRNILWQNLAFVLGSVMICWFSWISNEWVFFGLNLLFALFSSYHVIRYLSLSPKSHG